MKNCKKSLLASIIAFAFAIGDASAQFNPVAGLHTQAGRFIKNIQEHLKEKILQQTDGSFYLAGEPHGSASLGLTAGLTAYIYGNV